MKKLLLLPLFLLFTNIIHADQLALLTKDQAEKTIAYFKENDVKKVILWCACCDKEKQVRVTLTNYSYREAKDAPGNYEVVLDGTTEDGKTISKAVDLAYVHVQQDWKAVCLGKELGFKCDPCTESFSWF